MSDDIRTALRVGYRLGLLDVILDPEHPQPPTGIIRSVFEGERAHRRLELERLGLSLADLGDLALSEGGKNAQELADLYRSDLSGESWNLIETALLHFSGELLSFTISDLADAMETTEDKIRQQLRSLGRNQVVKDNGGVLPWEARWNGRQNIYTIRSDWAAIRTG